DPSLSAPRPSGSGRSLTLAVQKAPPRDVVRTAQLVRLVLDASRKMKHALTEAHEVQAEIEGHGTVRLTRERFEEVILPLLDRTGTACKRALKDAHLKPEQLDGVILVGGSTRVPAVRA